MTRVFDYIQEPSAMAPAEYLMRPLWEKEEPGAERVLDLMRGAGGKSTQLAVRQCAAWAY